MCTNNLKNLLFVLTGNISTFVSKNGLYHILKTKALTNFISFTVDKNLIFKIYFLYLSWS